MAENITPMKISAKIALISHKLLAPIRANSAFFIFMYLLGILVAYIEIPHQPKATVYANLWAELFLDLYIVCLFLMIFPKHVRRWIRAILYFMLYGISLVDVFCWEKFQTTINPSMLLLVGETNGREASEFFTSYFSKDIFFSNIGLVLLLLLIHILVSRFRF